ncbi:hypothetical protein [Sphingomonas immobilis]|uniref:Uncharacterized protein n=1 Tax=Sphingomonas immobilis TaxID=3063997 RepID=A0ABT8ZYT8_9SPHN|nr:hypothetical protein [Sphingomonas sp. CA1-15]MDO7842741.1 hypothetical protein [Sphingomonas sp. CA1-15]
MSDDGEMQAAATEAVAKAEAAATRRRWINLGEFVAVAGLIIAGVSLWLTWSDRRSDLADKQAEKRAEAKAQTRYEIAATVAKDGTLTLAQDEHHPLTGVTIAFPTALGIGTKTTPTRTVPKDWYEDALLKATSGEPDVQTGTLPVLVTVSYMTLDTPMTASALAEIVWQTHGRPLRPRALEIVGFNRRAGGGDQAGIDKLWKARKPQ